MISYSSASYEALKGKRAQEKGEDGTGLKDLDHREAIERSFVSGDLFGADFNLLIHRFSGYRLGFLMMFFFPFFIFLDVAVGMSNGSANFQGK